MRATIIAVGSELLGGDRADTNSLYLADVLSRFGVSVGRKVIVGDDLEDLAAELDRARSDSSLLLVTGGLGPTRDDLTREAVARSLGLGVERRPEIVEDIRRKFASFGREMPKVNEKQADVIEGATVLENARGTAPGLRIEAGATVIFLFPGVPHELHGLVSGYLEPWLGSRAEGEAIERRVFRAACLPESELEERLAPLYREHGGDGVSVLPKPGEITVRLTARGGDRERVAWLEPRARLVRELLDEFIFATSEDMTLEAEVGRLLSESGRSVVTAESCTGGGVAERLTAVPGSSAYFLGSAVTYSNELKARVLGVSEELLDRYGAVSEEVAEAMARGVRGLLGGDYALAVTGIAGPGGGSETKPVGTVFISLSGPGNGPDGVRVRRFQFPGDRQRVRRLTSQWALDTLRRRLIAVGK